MCPQNFSIIGVILKKMKLIELEGYATIRTSMIVHYVPIVPKKKHSLRNKHLNHPQK
jgi:hypothetical protein